MTPYVGEIRIFAGSFAPRGWALCQGQLLAISDFDALFSLLGTIYGGDGATTFALPDLRGRIGVGSGTGPGLANIRLGERAGAETNMLNTSQIGHAHNLQGSAEAAGDSLPTDNLPAAGTGLNLYTSSGTAVAMDSKMVQNDGASPPTGFNNVKPYLTLNFIIALQGVYPPRS